MTRAVRWSSAVYARLLCLHPSELRSAFGIEMRAVFEDDLRDALAERGASGILAVWWCTAVELLSAGLATAFEARGIVVPLISSAASALSLGGELALARAHGDVASMPSVADAFLAVVVWPSLTAAAVSFIAVRSGVRVAPLRLTEAASSEPL
jgi:hypothetical protein